MITEAGPSFEEIEATDSEHLKEQTRYIMQLLAEIDESFDVYDFGFEKKDQTFATETLKLAKEGADFSKVTDLAARENEIIKVLIEKISKKIDFIKEAIRNYCEEEGFPNKDSKHLLNKKENIPGTETLNSALALKQIYRAYEIIATKYLNAIHEKLMRVMVSGMEIVVTLKPVEFDYENKDSTLTIKRGTQGTNETLTFSIELQDPLDGSGRDSAEIEFTNKYNSKNVASGDKFLLDLTHGLNLESNSSKTDSSLHDKFSLTVLSNWSRIKKSLEEKAGLDVLKFDK